MSKRAKHLAFVMVMQAACLAAGLWMQNRYTVSSAAQAAERQAWTDLYQWAEAARPRLAHFDLATLTSGQAASQWQALLEMPRRVAGKLIIVDNHWRPVLPVSPAHVPDSVVAHWEVSGPVLPEMQLRRAAAAGWRPMRLALSDGEHIAAVSRLPGGQGHAVFHRSRAEIRAGWSSLLGSLPVIGIMTFVWTAALLGLGMYLIFARVHEDLDRERSRSATEALRQTKNLIRTRDAVIFGLAKLTESRDPDTGDHLERISVYCTTLASALRRHPEFRGEVDTAFVRLIGISSALHDIGKVGVEDRILLKQGPLTAEERNAMQAHTIIGGGCLREIERRLGGSNFLQMAREIAYAHHEHWDGSGYPRGLAGRAIPLSARIVAVADMYDALSTERVYKQALPHDECVAIIRSEAGRKLDPELLSVWLTVERKFHDIAQKYANGLRREEASTSNQPRPTKDSQREMEDLYALASDTA